jgi:hypothetical protein
MARTITIEPQKLIGFAPDLPQDTPGAFQDCDNIIPTLIGFKAAASPVNAGLAALSAPALGSALISRLDGTDRQFAGTASAMYENVSGTWNNVSRTGGYTLGTSATWRFAGFGNESLAVNGTDVLQTSLDGSFTNVPVSLQSISITAQGSGYTSTPTVTISPPNVTGGVPATATAVTSGTLSTITVTGAGAGYAYPPYVYISGGSGDGTAQVQATITGSVSRLYVVSGGMGYTSAPTVSITGAGGTGAAANAIIGTTATGTATIASGAVTGVTVVAGPWVSNALLGASGTSYSGAGYTAIPTVTFSAPTSGTTAQGTALVALMPNGTYSVVGVTITTAGSGYTTAPTVTFSAPSTAGQVVGFQMTAVGSGYNSIPTITITGGGATTNATAFCDVCGVVNGTAIVDSGAAFTSAPTLTCTPPNINQCVLSSTVVGGVLKDLIIYNPGTGYTTAPTITITGGGATTNATATCTIGAGGYVNSVTITGAGAGYTSAPTVTVTAPVVSSATATLTAAIVESLTAINFVSAGSGYTSNPTVTLSGGGVSDANQAKATAQIVQAPVGEVIFVANGQVFICNCSSPQELSGGDFWSCSGIYDQTQWDFENEQTLAAYGQLIDTPGPITAGTSLGPNAIIFKGSSMYFGTQTGYPVGWDFQAISKIVGASCQEAVVNAGSTLFFVGPDDFYAYQGYGLPTPIGQNVRRWFFNTMNPTYKDVMSSYYDQEQRVIYWAFVSNNSPNGEIDTCITYNWTTQTWGRMDMNMQCFVQILNGQITYAGLGTLYPTYNSLPDISYNSPFWIDYRVTPGYFDNTNTLQALAGASTGASITTNLFGDQRFHSTMQQFFVGFYTLPTAGTATWQGREAQGMTDPTQIATNATGAFVPKDARIDVDCNARWHNLVINFTGDFEAISWFPTMVQNGIN